jgi:hypothetical protein
MPDLRGVGRSTPRLHWCRVLISLLTSSTSLWRRVSCRALNSQTLPANSDSPRDTWRPFSGRRSSCALLLLAIACVSSGGCRETAPASAPEQPVVVTSELCTDVSAGEREWLPAEWQPFVRYTRTCTIASAQRKPAVLLISVWADRYYANQPDGVTQAAMPNPLLFSPSGSKLGTLPFNFPDDPPTKLRVTFTEWTNSFPRRIDLFLTDPAAGGDRDLAPLVWDEQRSQFKVSE